MPLPPNRPILLRIESSPLYLPVVRAAIEKACTLIGFDEDATGGIMLSVDEALTNVIRHAYDNQCEKPIEIELVPFRQEGCEGLRIRVRDYGRVVERSKIKSRDLTDVRPGGLGVHIMNECMDEVHYSPAEGGGTLLTMTRTTMAKSKGRTK